MARTLEDIEGRYVIVPPGEGVSLATLGASINPVAEHDVWRDADRAPFWQLGVSRVGETGDAFLDARLFKPMPSSFPDRATGAGPSLADRARTNNSTPDFPVWNNNAPQNAVPERGPGEDVFDLYSRAPLEMLLRIQAAARGIADHLYELATFPGRVLGTYSDGRDPPTEEEMRDWAAGTALTMLGIGGPNAVGGSVGAGGGKLARRAPLPMDDASRMARANEMGFHTDIPLYHGTATEFPAFSLTPPARNSRGPLAQTGPWTTRDPAYASDFAALSADLGTGSYPQVLPLLHRAEKSARIDAAGLSQREIAGAVRGAWEAGHDAVLIQNYTMGAFGKVAPTTNIVVRNPNQLRSRFAVFDPSKSHLADLLASLAIVSAAGVGGFGSEDRQ